MTGSNERPISRWSRLKQEERAAKKERGSAAPKEQAAVDSRHASLDPGSVPKETATDDGNALPSVESLTKDSDFTAFLKPGVPEDVSRAALRKLWQSDPVFGQIEELHDCFGDYANFPLITAKDTIYQVGKGMIDRVAEEAKKAAEASGEKTLAAPTKEREEEKRVATTETTEPRETDENESNDAVATAPDTVSKKTNQPKRVG